jgi:predicted MPP superfamily phosphohydrolase
LKELNSYYLPRRDFLLKGGATVVATATTILGLRELAAFSEYDPSNPNIDVVFQKVPGMSGRAYGIHLTDIHSGGDEAYVNADVLEQVVYKINQTLYSLGARADNTALIMTGDWISKEEQPKFHIKAPHGGETNMRTVPIMLEILQDLKADHRIGVLGNHDHIHKQRIELIKHILQSGIQLLDINSEYYKGDFPIPILGLPDYTKFSGYYSPSQVQEIANSLNLYDGYQIVATHNASVVDLAGLGRLVNNVRFLCGHTHGGHTKHGLFVPYALSDEYESEYVRGIYEVGGNLVQMADGIGQHPQAAFRQIPAGIIINVYEG